MILWMIVAMMMMARMVNGQNKIIGGYRIDIEQVPWQVSLQLRNGFHNCGGSIISDMMVVTANHCVEDYQPEDYTVVAGISKLSDSFTRGQRRAIAFIFRYPGFVDTSNGKDLALLLLKNPLDLSTPRAKSVPMIPSNYGLDSPGKVGLVTGWGRTEEGAPDHLMAVEVPIVSLALARKGYGFYISDDQLPAGDYENGGIDSCNGDSGGPLVVSGSDRDQKFLAGATSWGFNCALPRFPGLYARISSFSSWINNILEKTQNLKNMESAILQLNDITLPKGTQQLLDIIVPPNVLFMKLRISCTAGDADFTMRLAPTSNANGKPSKQKKKKKASSPPLICNAETSGLIESCDVLVPNEGIYTLTVTAYTAIVLCSINVTASS